MLSHFGHELHSQHQQFNMVFSELYKLASDTNTIMFTYLPLREIFLQDYSGLEKMLVLINFALFGASMCADNVDQEVGTAILYLMFSIAYFVTTTTCLSGANVLKNKISMSNRQDQESDASQYGNEGAAKVGKSGVGKNQSIKKQQTATKRSQVNDRKNVISAGSGTKYSSNVASAHLIQTSSQATTIPSHQAMMINTRKKNNMC